MFPVAHKTVFLLDESLPYLSTLCGQKVEFDVSTKSRQPSTSIPLEATEKSLWTCAVEAVSEYCRIIWDIYPDGERLISFVTSAGKSAHPALSWHVDDQNLINLNRNLAIASMTLARIANPRKQEENYMEDCLTAAVRAIGTCSAAQEAAKRDLGEALINRGRIIFLSWFRNDTHIATFKEKLATIINNHNSSSEDNKFPISLIEAVFINSFPFDDPTPSSKIVHVPNHRVSPSLSCEVHSTPSGTILAQKLVTLVLRHYSLASTTVTGIPMKEEQNASSSANYDVEIVHPAEAHIDLYKTPAQLEGIRVPKEGVEYDTIMLKWCTPRTNAVELHVSTGAVRVTPVDVNSRPSSCLTNFLLSGRTVMLEMPRSKTSKILSHMLSSHNHELYIHSLSTSRSILEDPPSISEGSGGRVTDYRINDFGELMKRNRLVRCKAITVSGKEQKINPIAKASSSLVRQTLYWPLAIGHTILFNIPQLETLLNLVSKDSLTSQEVNDCKSAIFQVVSMESKATPLPVPGISTKGKGPKREEVYKLLWKELEFVIRASACTPEHTAVLACLTEIHSKSDVNVKSEVDVKPSAEVLAWKELDGFTQMTEKEKSEFNMEPVAKKAKQVVSPVENCFGGSLGQESLLSMWVKKLKKESQKHAEFDGRIASGPTGTAPLYVPAPVAEKTAE